MVRADLRLVNCESSLVTGELAAANISWLIRTTRFTGNLGDDPMEVNGFWATPAYASNATAANGFVPITYVL